MAQAQIRMSLQRLVLDIRISACLILLQNKALWYVHI